MATYKKLPPCIRNDQKHIDGRVALLYQLTEIRSAIPVTSLWLSPPASRKMRYEAMALRGVDALKMATYFLQVGLGELVDNKEVVKAKAVGAVGDGL